MAPPPLCLIENISIGSPCHPSTVKAILLLFSVLFLVLPCKVQMGRFVLWEEPWSSKTPFVLETCFLQMPSYSYRASVSISEGRRLV